MKNNNSIPKSSKTGEGGNKKLIIFVILQVNKLIL